MSMTVRPAYLLAAMIILGWVIGVAGDNITVCPLDTCARASFYLYQVNLLVVNYHQFYELFSSNFVTDSLYDAAFNALAVIILDRISDSSQFNTSRYLAIFFFSAAIGNILTLFEGPNYVSAGASGGIFGLYAAIFSFSWAEERKIDNATLGIFLIIFITSILIGEANGVSVNYVAHLGGAIGGFISGPLLYMILAPKIQSYSQSTESSKTTKLIVSGILIALTIGTIWQFYVFVS